MLTAPVFCEQCGYKLPEGAVFCPRCGVRVRCEPSAPADRGNAAAANNIPPQAPAAENAYGETASFEKVTNKVPPQSSGAVNTYRETIPKGKPGGGIKISAVLYVCFEALFLSFLGIFLTLHLIGWSLLNGNAIPYYREAIIVISFAGAGISSTINSDKLQEKIRKESSKERSKEPFYKSPRFWGIVVCLIIASVIANTVDTSSPKGELRDYAQNQMAGILLRDQKILSALNEIVDADDFTAYAALKNEIVPDTEKLLGSAEGIHPEDSRLRKIHEIYVDYAAAKLKGFKLLLSAFEQDNVYDVYRAQEKLEEANDLLEEYIRKINNYCEELGVKARFEVKDTAPLFDLWREIT